MLFTPVCSELYKVIVPASRHRARQSQAAPNFPGSCASALIHSRSLCRKSSEAMQPDAGLRCEQL